MIRSKHSSIFSPHSVGIILFCLIFACSALSRAALGQSDAKAKAQPQTDTKKEAGKACPFNIKGVWRSDATSQNTPIYFSFSPDGAVLLLGHSADALPQDFEVITSVSYKLDKPAAPRRIEFSAWRGNDIFQQGVTSFDITEYDGDSFTTLDTATGRKTRWVREQTQRYFLTFAARSGAQQPLNTAFVMWTVLDGQQPKVEALGARTTKDKEDKEAVLFEHIPAELYNEITEMSEEEKKSKKYETAIMRLELNESEFEKTHKVFEQWEKYVKTAALPHSDPYVNAMEFIKRAAESIDLCRESLKLRKLDRAAIEEIAAKHAPRQQPLEFIKAMRKKNDEAHLPDALFPSGWRPVLQLPSH